MKKVRIWFSRGVKRFNEQPAWVQVSLIPLVVTVLGFLASRSVNLAKPSWVTGASFFGYLFFVFLGSLVSYANTLRLKAIEMQRQSLSMALANLDVSVERKTEKLGELVSTPQNRSAASLLSSARGRLSFANSASTLTHCLFTTVSDYLERTGRLKGASIHLALLVPDPKTRVLHVLGRTRDNNGLRTVASPTDISIDDKETMAGILWSTKIMKVMCSDNTAEAEICGEFKFVEEAERNVVKSIFVYRIDNDVTGSPFGFWSIDADLEGVLPNKTEADTIKDLTQIFTFFGRRIGLELVYKDVFEIVEEAMEGITWPEKPART